MKLIASKSVVFAITLFVIITTTNSVAAQHKIEGASSVGECEVASNCIEQSNWQIGVAVGLGARSNPLVGGDTIPQVILIDIAWYGESAYFDNGEVGYKFIQSEYTGLESYLTIDRERAFFNFWHPTNILVSGSALTPSTPDDNPEDPSLAVSIEQIERRNWAVNAGLRMHLYGDNYEWAFSAEHDISSVHDGYKAALTYQHFWRGDDWKVMVRPNLIWKSNKLVNYYYGLTDQDRLIYSRGYTAKGGFQPAISVLYTKQVNPNWQWIVSASYQKLHKSMTNSPLVRRDNISSLFVGAGYMF